MAANIGALAAEAEAAQAALDRLRAEHSGIQAKLGRAAQAGGGGWTPRLRRRQAELSEQRLAAEVLLARCHITRVEAELVELRAAYEADLRACAHRPAGDEGSDVPEGHARSRLLKAASRLTRSERERSEYTHALAERIRGHRRS